VLVILVELMVESMTYIWRRSVALQVRLDRTVLLVEERHVRHKVLDNVHVGKRVDARFLGSVCGNAAYGLNQHFGFLPRVLSATYIDKPEY
jgi:hypothetical protein